MEFTPSNFYKRCTGPKADSKCYNQGVKRIV